MFVLYQIFNNNLLHLSYKYLPTFVCPIKIKPDIFYNWIFTAYSADKEYGEAHFDPGR